MKSTVGILSEKLKASINKHGLWDNYTERDMWVKIQDELQEVIDAWRLEDYDTEHGVASELLDTAVCCVKMAHQLIQRNKETMESQQWSQIQLNLEGECTTQSSPN